MSQLHFGIIAHVTGSPFQKEGALEIIEDGALWLDDEGMIQELGPRKTVEPRAGKAVRHDHGKAWILPGFVDGHIHFPQFYATAAHGRELLDWLNRSIFPNEARFADEQFATNIARRFVAHLLACGTTTALVFGSQFPHAMSALFDAAEKAGMRLISGLTLMDRFAPDEILTPAETVYEASARLIKRVEASPLLDYAVTPRFAISCTPELLAVCRSLLTDFPTTYMQTHINENAEEIRSVGELFPEHHHYLDVYDRAGLLCPRSVLAHGIHSSPEELAVMRDKKIAVCHCPASNLYLGSGLFSLKRHLDHEIPVLVGTDVGAGTNFSIIEELGYVYKVQQMDRFMLGAAELLYLGTLAGAEALHLQQRTGNLAPGKEADFVVLSTADDEYLDARLEYCPNREDQLFTLLNLGGPRHIRQTYVRGRETGALVTP